MLPHITNSAAGVNRWDPVVNNCFEVYFTVPDAIRAQFGKDEMLLTEHVLSVSGLDALGKAPGTETQKFMGTDRSYIKPKLDSTRAEIEVNLSLNLRNVTDNYIYKLFRAWARLGYDIATGERHLKEDYVADWMKISRANVNGSVYQEVLFKDVIINGDVTGLNELNYDGGEAQTLNVKFVSDWWDETLA